MEKPYTADETFEKADFSEKALKGDYENCTFVNCNFSGADLSDMHFTECVFDGCNISLAKLIKTTLADCKFKNCKMTGLHFEQCNEYVFTVDFENCTLNLSSFYKLKIKKTSFKNSTLHEVDFTEADVTNSLFDNCDLQKAIFENTVLEKADLRTAYNYSINPEINRIKKAKFSVAGIAGLLDKYDIDVE